MKLCDSEFFEKSKNKDATSSIQIHTAEFDRVRKNMVRKIC
jgi:hypothetical protein